MFEIIFLIAVGLYLIQSVIFIIGAKKKFQRVPYNKLPSISIIVAARNEENNILSCMESLNALVYPSHKIEIVIVNDHSTDATGKIIEDYIDDKPKFISLIPQSEIGSLRGKANAIANAVRVAKGDVILTTDADCIVHPNWAITIASYYQMDVAMVCGFTNQFERNSFEGMQSMDFIYLLTVAAGTMNLDKPLSCIGNNMSYRKSVYDEIGGYEAIPFSVTEDFKLLMAFHELKKYKIIYPMDADTLVTSKPCDNMKSLYWQKKRWGVGGLDSDLFGFGVMLTALVTHVCVLLTPFLFSLVWMYLIILKVLIDYFILNNVYRKLNLTYKVNRFLVFEIYFLLYVIILPVLVIFSKRIKWKGRQF